MWVEGWQIRCCGTPFGVGSQVEWEAGAVRDDAFLRVALGEDLASSIDYCEDHHGQVEDKIKLRGEVVGVTAAFCRYAPSRKGGLVPVRGSTRTEPRSAVDNEESAVDGSLFLGYAVDLRV